MYKHGIFEIKENAALTENVFRLVLCGDTSAITAPGQFANIKIDGFFLRRPLSVCDYACDVLTLIYKVAGSGTKRLSAMEKGERLDLLTGLGNGYLTEKSGTNPVLIGGGSGVPPMYNLAKKLISEGKAVSVILGFNTASEIFYEQEFKDTGARVYVTTADGSYGIKGFVTEPLKEMNPSHVYACGPEGMLKAVYNSAGCGGSYSFERRMGCGFGACMGCTCKTKYGNKRICKDGPVLEKEEIVW